MKGILWALSIILAFSADAQTRGVSYIGMCHPSVKGEDVVRIFDGESSIAIHFLIRTFNPGACPSFQHLAQDPRPMLLHISLLNGPGLRNRRLRRYEYLHGHTIESANKAIERRDPKVRSQVLQAIRQARKFIAMRGDRPTQVRIKPCMECNFGKRARRMLAGLVRRHLPGVEQIDNPLWDSCLKGFLCETHGMNTNGDIIDLDGLDYMKADRERWNAEASSKVASFIWRYCNNGFQDGEEWKPPKFRSNFCGPSDIQLFNSWRKGQA